MEKLPAYDCHCHILPGLDDGARTMEESVFLAGKLASYGFERAVCTPHSTRLYRNTPATVIPACERLQEALDKLMHGQLRCPRLPGAERAVAQNRYRSYHSIFRGQVYRYVPRAAGKF